MKQRQKHKKKSHVPVRINILFFSVFVLFSLLILRLGFVQIVQGEAYKKQVERTDEVSVNHAAPRGEIFDRNGKKLVYNTPEKAITYTPPKHPQPKKLLDIAKKLAELIDMTKEDKEKVTERDLKDIWLLENDNGNSKITDEEIEMFKAGKLDDKDLYKLKLERITKDELKTIDLNVASIFRKLSRAIALTPTIIKNENVTDKEYALVSENLDDLPGVDITTDWDRKYTYGDTLKSILGRVSSSEQGLPQEKLQYYTTMGYNMNDRVGQSYIEELFEELLQGQKTRVKTITDKKGNIIDTKIVHEGKSGKDLVLTIDVELQKEVEKIIEEELLKMIKYPRTETLDRAFVVLMDPNTGEILTLAGKQYNRETKEMLDFARGTFMTAYEPGSAVKGATVLTGYQTGVISPGEKLLDEVLHIKGTPDKSSWQIMGLIDDLTALERSSNVYMFKIAIAIGEGHYIPNGPLPLNLEKINTLRYYFNQFGLGVKTGIGFKNEIDGLKPAPNEGGKLLDFAIGQFDTYTPLQMAQYVSTIANGGYRIKPQLLKEIRDPEVNKDGLGRVVETIQPKVLNRIDMKEEWIERVQQGFWRVMHGPRGTATRFFSSKPYNPAGKTGTAQSPVYYNGNQSWNLTLVAYAPADKPEIAMSVMVPWAYYGGDSPYSINNIIGSRVLDKYFELKEKRMENNQRKQQNNGQTDENSENGNNE